MSATLVPHVFDLDGITTLILLLYSACVVISLIYIRSFVMYYNITINIKSYTLYVRVCTLSYLNLSTFDTYLLSVRIFYAGPFRNNILSYWVFCLFSRAQRYSRMTRGEGASL